MNRTERLKRVVQAIERVYSAMRRTVDAEINEEDGVVTVNGGIYVTTTTIEVKTQAGSQTVPGFEIGVLKYYPGNQIDPPEYDYKKVAESIDVVAVARKVFALDTEDRLDSICESVGYEMDIAREDDCGA